MASSGKAGKPKEAVADTAGSGGDAAAPAGATGAAGATGPIGASGLDSAKRTRPIQVTGHYPERHVTYYQVSTSDLRALGVFQAVSTIAGSLGTFAMSLYFDYRAGLADQPSPAADPFMQSVTNVAFWAWIGFWIIAVGAFIWRQTEWARIRVEHGEPFIKWPWNR